MLTRLLVVTSLTLVLATPSFADGVPAIGVSIGGQGVAGTAMRYVAFPARGQTLLEQIRKRDAVVTSWVTMSGNWGIPTVAFDGSTGGLARNGSVLVLGGQGGAMDCTPQGCYPYRTVSRFQLVNPTTLRTKRTLALAGDFSFDALSPDGRRLYLIQHTSSANLDEYRVRAYDVRHDRLLPGAIADRTQRGWTMQGSPVTRVTSANGRFVYTLYMNPGGYPFVHALDAARGTAHCIGLPWTQDQSLLSAMHMTLGDHGRTLSIAAVKGRPFFTVDTRTYHVTVPNVDAPAAHHAFPWWIVGVVAGVVAVAGAAIRLHVSRLVPRRAAPA